MAAEVEWLEGGVTAVPGFLAGGVAAGIKPSGKKDLALIHSPSPTRSAAVFTTNQVKGAPVLVSMEHARTGALQAIVASSGCANVCTGERGLRDAFYTVHQMSPKRWVLAQRLQRARRALIEVRSAEVTVTRVAMDNGFHQLGRFAVTYRQAFGETPSETLRGIWPKCTNERPPSCGTERAI